MRGAVLFMLASAAMGQTPRAVLDVFREVTQALAERQPERFLEQFDAEMPGFAALRRDVIALVATEAVSSTIEVVSDAGDDERRQMQIDWLLKTSTGAPRRAVLKMTLERRGRKWKITALDPAAFFTPPV
jgi:hypothetical protein